MTKQSIDEQLVPTLADLKVTPSEKKALQSWIAREASNEAQKNLIRSRAFELIRDRLPAGDPKLLLTWLEDFLRLLNQNPQTAPSAIESAAFFSPGGTCVAEIIRMFKNARVSCDVCVFTITDDRVSNVIMETHKRGVKVRIITDDEKAHDLGSDAFSLSIAGIPVRIDRSTFHMHHKFAIFDDRHLLNGSFNWTRSAAENNEENLTITNDPKLVKAFKDRFESMWKKWESI
jgi:mitochondrial cardiolipin hydrolase